MAHLFLPRVYDLEKSDLEDFYDAWSDTYDAELTQNGYAIPARCAAMLGASLPDRTAEILDFGCGTGLSGVALREAGFTTIDGIDISEGMLEKAEARDVYRRVIWSGGPPEVPPESYDAVTAMGAIGPGAAPASLIGALLPALRPGGILVLSLSDHALADAECPAALDAQIAAGRLDRVAAEHGPALPGIDLGATIHVLRRA